MGKVTNRAAVAAKVLTMLAVGGWVVFIVGFSNFNTETSFFEQIESLSPSEKEVAFIPFNSHYIVAVLSPILFIVMAMMTIMMMTFKNKWGPYISAIMSVPVFILVVFVMISAGVVLYGYSNTITLIRLNPELGTSSSQELLRAVYTMFAGMILEVFFLTAALITVFIGAILAEREEKDT